MNTHVRIVIEPDLDRPPRHVKTFAEWHMQDVLDYLIDYDEEVDDSTIASGPVELSIIEDGTFEERHMVYRLNNFVTTIFEKCLVEKTNAVIDIRIGEEEGE